MPGATISNTPSPVIAYVFGPFRLDLVMRRLILNGNPIPLPSRTFDILKTLVENRGELVTKEFLFKHVWLGRFVEENNLTVRISELRKALREPAEHRFIETVPGYGYRFVAKVREVSEAPAKSQDEGFKSLAVLPLINENNQQKLEYVCEGVTETLITSFSHIANLRVMARSTVFRYKRSDLDPRTVGEELDVQIVLAGKVNQSSKHLVFDLEMIDAKSGWHIWGAKYRRRVSDLVTLPDEIVKEVVPNLRLTFTTTEEKQVSNGYPANSKAYEMYLKGRYFWNKRTIWWTRKAIQYFRRAIELDPRYSLAFVGLADTYLAIAGFETRPAREAVPKAKAAVLEALKIDSELPDAHLTQAKIKSSYELDWEGAEKEFKLAIQSNRFDGHARQHYANFLTKLGRFDEALSEINEAFSLDPLSIAINLTMGKVYYFARKPALAIKKARELLEIEPSYGPANGLIGFAYLEMGRFEGAITQFELMFDSLSYAPTDAPAATRPSRYSDPEALGLLGYAYGVAGKRDKALEVLEQLTELGKRRYIQPHNIGLIYLGLGEDDSAFEWLDRAFVDRCSPLTYMKVWPFFDRLRTDPRYIELVQRLRLPL